MKHTLRRHYTEKYPGGHVKATEDQCDVWNSDGEHCVSVVKNGFGTWNDESKAAGCKDGHCLAPLATDRKKHTVGGRVRSQSEAEASEKETGAKQVSSGPK